MSYLQLINGPQEGARYPLESDKMTIGRHPTCDIIADASAVSRYHAQITRNDDAFLVEDLNSRNGTFVNEQAVRGQRRLADGDEVRICDLVFRYQDAEMSIGEAIGRATGTLSAVMVDDDVTKTESSIMSKLDLSSANARLGVSAEIKLKAFLELTHSLAQSLTVDEVLTPVLETLFTIFPQADRGFIVFRVGEKQVEPKCAKFRGSQTESARISRTIVNYVMDQQQAIKSADAVGDQRFGLTDSIAQFQIRTLMCAPLITAEGKVIGAVQIDTTDPQREFSEEDLDILAAVSTYAAFAINSARMHEEALEQRALQRDLELAHQVQMALLPDGPPSVSGYEFFDHYQAANHIGGDYFNYIPLSDGRLAMILADVSGHGIAAALLMTKLAAEVRSFLAITGRPADVLRQLNNQLCTDGVEDRFVTMVLAVAESGGKEISIANAGHQPPLRCNAAGELEDLAFSISGPPLGVVDDFEYGQETVTLSDNDVVAIWTDGITEAMNEKGEQFGNHRFRSRLKEAGQDLKEVGQRLIDDVRRFVGSSPQSDDICMICFKHMDRS